MIQKSLWTKGNDGKRTDSSNGEIFLSSLVQKFVNHPLKAGNCWWRRITSKIMAGQSWEKQHRNRLNVIVWGFASGSSWSKKPASTATKSLSTEGVVIKLGSLNWRDKRCIINSPSDKSTLQDDSVQLNPHHSQRLGFLDKETRLSPIRSLLS